MNLPSLTKKLGGSRLSFLHIYINCNFFFQQKNILNSNEFFLLLLDKYLMIFTEFLLK